MRYELTPEPQRPAAAISRPPKIATPAAQAAPKGTKAKGWSRINEWAEFAHGIFTSVLLGLGIFALLAWLYLTRMDDKSAGVFAGAGLTLITAALVLRGIERCARALEKLAGRE